MSPAEVEQIKLRANFLNSIASGSVIASVITPAVGLSIGVIDAGTVGFIVVASACGFWGIVGFIIHLLAIRHLGRLE